MALRRVRALLSGVLGAIVAGASGRIFDVAVAAAVVVPLLVAVAGVATLSLRAYVRAASLAAAVVAGTAVVVLVEGGRVPADVVDALTSGARRLLSTEWPSPRRAELVGAVAAIAGLATAVSVFLGASRRWHLLPLLPHLVAFTLVIAASAPAGSALPWLLPLGLVAAAFAALVPSGELGDTVRILVGERRAGLLTLVAVGLAAAVAVPVGLGDRADPRREQTASAVEPIVDPVEAVVALREAQPSQPRYRITQVGGPPGLPARWRTAVLDEYDGQRWSPRATLSPIGRRLGPERTGAVDVDIELLRPTDIVPLPGAPVSVDAPVETDASRTIVRLVEPGEAGQVVRARSDVDAAPGSLGDGALASRPVDEIAGGFASLAVALGGDGTIAERLERIRTALRDEFELDPGAPASGLQQPLLERFITETRRGTEEQFVTSFVLLARALGVDARVATGYRTDRTGDAADREAGVVTSADASVWPEVRLDDGTWVAVDPVPPEPAVAEEAEEPPAREVAPAAPQPPVVPPAENQSATPDEDEPASAESDDGWPAVLVWLAVGGAAVGAVVVPVLLVTTAIVLVKRARRRRRLRDADPGARVRGAWAEATDALVDAGLRIPPSWTDDEIARAGAPVASGAQAELSRLGTLSSAATFTTAPTAPSTAEDAVATLEQVEAALASTLSRWQRLRWRLSLRSLRRATRSPVSAHARRR